MAAMRLKKRGTGRGNLQPKWPWRPMPAHLPSDVGGFWFLNDAVIFTTIACNIVTCPPNPPYDSCNLLYVGRVRKIRAR